jgi:SAM-dependent methyltransferase
MSALKDFFVSNSSALLPEFARHYLQNIAMGENYGLVSVPCEICGSVDLEIIQSHVDIGRDRFGVLPVQGCLACGYVFRSQRFEERFYRDFYECSYRSVLFGRTTPEKAFVIDQIQRGRKLYSGIVQYLPKSGRMLDVGCSSGGLMIAFREHGWTVCGSDPDPGFAQFGRDRLKLPVECGYAEDMALEPQSLDLVLITGSLEHVYDLAKVLKICRAASAPGALIVVEGRALGHSRIEGCFSHTHRRYFDQYSLPAALQRHGWTAKSVTNELLSGNSRPGGVFCIATASTLEPSPIVCRDAAEIRMYFGEIRKDTSRKLAQGAVIAESERPSAHE